MITKNNGQRNLKRKYIEATYEILEQVGMEGFTIRKVADKVGCSSALLYKHFHDAEHLVSLASVRYLRQYSQDTQTLSSSASDYLELNLLLWESFAFYAFKNIPIFENLFFGKNMERIQEIVFEYYQEFPEEISGLQGYFSILMQSNNLIERDFMMLKKAANDGYITLDAADFLSRTDVYIFRGMLDLYRSTYADPDVARKATNEFMTLIRENYELHRVKRTIAES